MTLFTIKPVEEVLIADLIQDDLENFLYISRVSNVASAIWVENMIMGLIPPLTSEKNVERYFEGTKIYERVFFVKYPKYTKTVKWNGGNYELALRNYKNIPRFVELAKWIKTQPVWDKILEITK